MGSVKAALTGSIDVFAGKIPLELPPYMSLEYNKETGKASLSILDRNNRKQREMWGMWPLELSRSRASLQVPDYSRYYPRIPEQSHPWSIGRTYSHFTISWRGIQSNDRTLSSLRRTRIPRTAVCFLEGRLLASHRARRSSRHESKHTAADAHTVGRAGEGSGESIRGQDQEVEGTGALQGEGHLRERGNHQAEGKEDQVMHAYICVLLVGCGTAYILHSYRETI